MIMPHIGIHDRLARVLVLTLHAPGRPELARCVASVARQRRRRFAISHRVVVDVLAGTGHVPYAESVCRAWGAQLRFGGAGQAADGDRLAHIANLRRAALEGIDADYLIWADDDNWWEPDHLARLVATARANPGALAHSWRCLWTRTGVPYVALDDPWSHANAGEHERALELYGIRTPGSPVMRDRMYDAPVRGYVGSIDLGEILFPVEMALSLGFSSACGDGMGEDDLLLRQLVERGTRLIGTSSPTLNYVVPCSSGPVVGIS